MTSPNFEHFWPHIVTLWFGTVVTKSLTSSPLKPWDHLWTTPKEMVRFFFKALMISFSRMFALWNFVDFFLIGLVIFLVAWFENGLEENFEKKPVWQHLLTLGQRIEMATNNLEARLLHFSRKKIADKWDRFLL
jgi:hypothetical protein